MVAVRIAIAGSSGSIGTQTLDVIAQSPDKFEVVALGVGSSVDVVVEQAKRWKPRVVVVTDEAARGTVAALLPGCPHPPRGARRLVPTQKTSDQSLSPTT